MTLPQFFYELGDFEEQEEFVGRVSGAGMFFERLGEKYSMTLAQIASQNDRDLHRMIAGEGKTPNIPMARQLLAKVLTES